MQENRFQLAGYLAAKPTLRYLPSSMPVANARLGQTYRLPSKDKPADRTNWFSLVFYGDLAILATELEKGTNLYVDGTFDQRPFVAQDKYTRNVYEVTLQKFSVVGAGGQDRPVPPKPHHTLPRGVRAGGAPSIEFSEIQDTWVL